MRLRTYFLLGLGLGLAIPIFAGLGWSVASAEIIPQEAPTETSELTLVGLQWIPDDPRASFGPYPRSEKMIAIEKALERPISFDFVETPLTDVIGFLRQQTKVNIVLDENGLAMCDVERDTEMTLHVHEVALRSALKLLLDRLEMEYIVRDGVILITDKIETGATLEVRVYPVADLVAVRGKDRGEILAKELIELIRGTVQSYTWVEWGGVGGIAYSVPAFSLVVSQSQSVHAEIEALLSNLRAAREKRKSPLAPGMGDLSTVHEFYLKRRDEERAHTHELEKGWTTSNSVEAQLAHAKLQLAQAEAALAVHRLQQAKKKAEDRPKKKQAKAKGSNS